MCYPDLAGPLPPLAASWPVILFEALILGSDASRSPKSVAAACSFVKSKAVSPRCFSTLLISSRFPDSRIVGPVFDASVIYKF